MDDEPEAPKPSPWKRAGINFGAFFLAFVFVWVVFDNLALALLLAILFAGGGEAVQRATKRK